MIGDLFPEFYNELDDCPIAPAFFRRLHENYRNFVVLTEFPLVPSAVDVDVLGHDDGVLLRNFWDPVFIGGTFAKGFYNGVDFDAFVGTPF